MEQHTHPTAFVLDDNINNCRIFRHILEQAGYYATLVTSGQAALDTLTVQTFTLAVIDLMLPDISGLTILEAIQQNPMHSQMTIIVATANPHMANGDVMTTVDFVIYKPIDEADFGHLVERLKTG
jgi:two-component system sensor histidine kinase ChiS